MKALLMIVMSLFLLTACGKKEVPKIEIDFNGPTAGPDWDKIKPSYGPNDPVPVLDDKVVEIGETE